MAQQRDPLLIELLTAFNEVRLVERYLTPRSSKLWQYGECLGETITVNPAPHVVDTVLHELIHHVRPEWSELSVRRRATQLLKQLTHQEVSQIYQEYRSRCEQSS